MADLTEKVHEVHCSTSILSVEIHYNGSILVKDTPDGKAMAFIRSKAKEKMKTSREGNQSLVKITLTINQHALADAESSLFLSLSNPTEAYSLAPR